MNVWHDLQWVLPLRSPALTHLAIGFSWLGYTTFIMFFIAIGYWTWSKAIFYRLLILVAINAVLNAYIKDWVQDPRPPLDLRLDDLVGTSYGLPSGHAQMATAMWLWLAWELRRRWVWVLCTAIAIGVMASRMYLGVHDLEDVVVGATLGAASLLLFETARTRSTAWQQHPAVRTALFALLTGLALWSWPGAAPEYIPTLAGWVIAVTWCMRYDQQHWGLPVPTTAWRRLLAGLLGAACFMGEQKLLKWTGVHLAMPPMLWALLKGLIGGGFVSLLMPWLLHSLKLTPHLPQAGYTLQNKP